MPVVSIVVPPRTSWAQSWRLIGSVDQLTTPVDDFELVFLQAEAEEVPEQLTRLVDYRPNLRVVSGLDWCEQLRGSYVLRLGGELTLVPTAVDDLLARARSSGADIVLGRIVGRLGEIPAADDPGPDEAVWLVRREHLEPGVDPSSPAWVGTGPELQRATSDDRAVAVRHEAGAAAPPLAAAAQASWEAGVVALDVELDSSVDGVETARLALQHARTFDTYWIGAQVEGSAGRVRITARLDPRTAAGGEPLTRGAWRIRLESRGGQGVVVHELPAVAPAPALVDSTGYLLAGTPHLSLDVGPASGRLLPRLDPSAAVVTESHRGSWLRLEVTGLHTHDTDGLDGTLFLDGLAFRSRLDVADGRAAIVGFVSGVAGKAPIETAFGTAAKQPTGLSLHVDGLGAMKVITTPPAPAKKAPAKKAPAKKAPAKKATAKKTGSAKAAAKKAPPPRRGAVAKLRRAVPGRFDPILRRLGRVPAVRKLYRGLTRAS